ncbi:hypothetical protein BH09VER1_BH09VER1_19460 [soil metagenome]
MKKKNYSDWVVALSVVGCSAVLFAALALALSGTMISKPGHTLRVNFHDVTGINLGAKVKYAGAPVGKVSAVRILSNEERIASGDPLNVVELTLALDLGTPKLAVDTKASLSADTLLSDKFILLNAGSSLDKFLAENAVIQGTTPTTFDKLARDIDGAIEGLRGVLGGANEGTGDIFARIKVLLDDTQSVVNEAKPIIQDIKPVIQDAKALASDGKQLASDARQLLADNKTQITSAIGHADKAAGSFEQLGNRSNAVLATNAPKLTGTIADFKVTSENLKVTATYSKILLRNLNLKPSQLLWGTAKPPSLPSESEIIRSPKPIPAN